MIKSDILYLYDSEQIPFGKLSPLYRSLVKVGTEEASSVISYCYAGLVKPGGIKNSILKESGKDARLLALNELKHIREDIFNSSLEEGLLEKVRQDKEARKLLLSTKNNNIVYESSNKELGVDESGGKNKVGNALMKIRKIIQREVEDKKEKKLNYIIEWTKYVLYTTYKFLENKIKTGVDDLSIYLNKDPVEIMEIAKLPPFPGSFSKDIQDISMYSNSDYAKNMAADLREMYAEDYNRESINLQKKDILNTYLIDRVLRTLPSSGNYKELYNRYKQLKQAGDFNEEYEILSRTFKDQIKNIRDFIIKLSETNALTELEDRVYELAVNGLIEIPVPKLKTLPIKEISEEEYKKFEQDSQKLAEKFKEYKRLKEQQKTEELQKEIEKQKLELEERLKKYREDENRLLKIERFYMRKAKNAALKNLRKGLKSREDSSEESDESEEAKNVFELWKYYEDKYPKLYEDIMDLKRQFRAEVAIENAMRENLEIASSKKLKPQSNFKKDEYVDLINYVFEKAKKDRDVPSPLRDLPEILEEDKEDEESVLVKVNETSILSPTYDRLIEINNFTFPNVMSYVYYKLLLHIFEGLVKETKLNKNPVSYSHDLLLKSETGNSRDIDNYKPLESIVEVYDFMDKIYRESILKMRATKALESKFKQENLRKLLLASNPRVLLYNDNNDSILGTGQISQGRYEGLDIIGKVMTEIRQKFSEIYGRVVIEEVEVSPQKVISRELDVIMNDYMRDKMREMLYVFILYNVYIKNSKDKTITLSDANFVINKLYSNIYNKLKKIEKEVKLLKITKSFQSEAENFLDQYKFKINRDALNKLWSYIYILNEMMNVEIVDQGLKLYGHRKLDVVKTPIEYESITDFISAVEYEPKDWFIETVKDNMSKFGDICVGLGLTYNRLGKNKKFETKCINVVSEDKIEEIYLQLLLPILGSIKDDAIYKDFYINIYSSKSNVESLRSEYVTKQQNKCSELIKDNKKMSCVMQTFIDILSKIKSNNQLPHISSNVISFVSLLLSTSGLERIDLDVSKTFEPSNKDDLSENMSLLSILSNRLELNTFDKYSGDQTVDNKLLSGGNMDINISNSKMVAIKISVSALRKDRQLNQIYVIKYEEKTDGSSVFNVESKGDETGIEFSRNDRGDIIYKLPEGIWTDVDKISFKYQVISSVKSTNLVSIFNRLSQTTNGLSRVLTFLEEKEDFDLFDREEDEYEKDVIADLKKQAKKTRVVKETEEDEGEDEGDEEYEGEDEEDEGDEDSLKASDDDVEDEEEEEENYYEEGEEDEY